ncbi:hypothetical protein QBC46DRAFT_374476 [Diplogelasinospora grovesii]|uniref:Mannose-1-phosphate guanyltransferase n=1 Tax=Diplogelasinospora grovesii TaxID=303347 RepID=A0AAN6NGP4_9PEZI|nr:hypothetical protein QBC46DRAFT_374476 [Diplogelasinospora grovesii]
MPHAVTIATPGLQALILCGPGSSFPTFTANPDENPKALLPIANRPMVWYPLEFCYRAGITNITLICPPSASEAIQTALNTNPFLTSLPYPRPDLLAPKGLDQNTGTAEILRLPEVQSVVTSDFLVLPCDLVCELGGDKLLQAWMVKSASLGDLLGDSSRSSGQRSGGLGVWYQTKTAAPIKSEETDFVATVPCKTSSSSSSILPQKGSLLPHISKVVYSMPTDSLKDLVEEKTGLPIRHGLLRSHPRVRMLTTYRDAHIYIFPRWIMDFVAENDRLETIGEDVIGWWAKAGWQKGLSQKLGFDHILGSSSNSTEEDKMAASGILSPPTNKEGSMSPPSKTATTTAATTTTQTMSVDQIRKKSEPVLPGPQHHDDTTTTDPENKNNNNNVPPMLAYIHPYTPPPPAAEPPKGGGGGGGKNQPAPVPVEQGPIIRRVDTAQLLLQISLQLAKLPSVEDLGGREGAASPYAHARKVAYPEGVKPRTTITKADTLVADNVTIQEKTSLKECVIGANCQINEGAKLTQCLLMDGVVVGKNCKLTRCILGKRSEIGEGCVLADCEVQENLLVEPKTEAKDEKFMSSSGLEASGDDDDEEEESGTETTGTEHDDDDDGETEDDDE